MKRITNIVDKVHMHATILPHIEPIRKSRRSLRERNASIGSLPISLTQAKGNMIPHAVRNEAVNP
ncbi:MAG TPA: hypothetical protein PLR25_05700, partial [Planctomycetaceae bacterium]|nr:hypothetical protein [Planctomycetaceae bacterium]